MHEHFGFEFHTNSLSLWILLDKKETKRKKKRQEVREGNFERRKRKDEDETINSSFSFEEVGWFSHHWLTWWSVSSCNSSCLSSRCVSEQTVIWIEYHEEITLQRQVYHSGLLFTDFQMKGSQSGKFCTINSNEEVQETGQTSRYMYMKRSQFPLRLTLSFIQAINFDWPFLFLDTVFSLFPSLHEFYSNIFS